MAGPLMLPVHQIPNGDLQFQRLYRLMAFIHGLLLSHGSLAQSLRLDDLLLRQLEQPGSLTSISRVAMACGYISLASFSRDFQRTFGISPSKLLRNHRDRSDPPCRTPDPRT